MINELTEKQKEILIKNRDFFIKSALTYKEIDRNECNKYIDWLYNLCKLQKPIKIYVSSPYAAQIAANYINILFLGKNIEKTKEQIGEQIGEQVGEQVKSVYYEFSFYTSICYQSWYSWCQTMIDIGIKLSDNFSKLILFNNIGIYDCIHLNGVSIICEKPIKVIRANNRLHNPNGPAIEWRDGYKLYAINGRILPPWIWEKTDKNEITKDDFLKERNSEIRGGIYAVMGQKKIASLLETKEIDSQTLIHEYGVETISLIKTIQSYKEIGDVPFAWVKVQCPSTSTEYMLGVEPQHTNALEALASTSPFKASQYKLTRAS